MLLAALMLVTGYKKENGSPVLFSYNAPTIVPKRKRHILTKTMIM